MAKSSSTRISYNNDANDYFFSKVFYKIQNDKILHVIFTYGSYSQILCVWPKIENGGACYTKPLELIFSCTPGTFWEISSEFLQCICIHWLYYFTQWFHWCGSWILVWSWCHMILSVVILSLVLVGREEKGISGSLVYSNSEQASICTCTTLPS